MQAGEHILVAGLKARGLEYVIERIVDRSYFDVAPIFGGEQRLQIGDQRAEFSWAGDERRAVIGERQGNEAVAGEPTADARQDDTRRGGRSRAITAKHERIVIVGVAKRLKPALRMEYRSARVMRLRARAFRNARPAILRV